VFIPPILRAQSLIALAMAMLIATAAYGFAAANTVPATNAGDGSGAVSGYSVSNVVYVLESADPTKLDNVTFTLTPQSGGATAGTVKVQLVNGGTWYTASNVSNDSWIVDPAAGALSVSAVDTLHIVAHD
jgi:hypothetical protein